MSDTKVSKEFLALKEIGKIHVSLNEISRIMPVQHETYVGLAELNMALADFCMIMREAKWDE